MFRINRQIPRCAYLGFPVIIAFCYNVLLEPCDGFSDSLPLLLVFYATLGVCFLVLAFSYLCGLDLSDYVCGFKDNSFTYVVASLSLLGR